MNDLRTPSVSGTASEQRGDAAKTALAATGLLAAFGVAACCALPVALGALGIGSAAFIGVAVLVGPYQVHMLAVFVVGLGGAAFILWRQRRARACGNAGRSARPALDRASKVAIAVALALLALSFWIQPPL